jgi:hypothetical protein
MTSCPVVYSVDDMNKKFSSQVNFNHLVVTITDRAYIEKQIKILEVGPKLFPSRRITLALHQDYGNAPLWSLAKKLGYEIFRSDSYEDFIVICIVMLTCISAIVFMRISNAFPWA